MTSSRSSYSSSSPSAYELSERVSTNKRASACPQIGDEVGEPYCIYPPDHSLPALNSSARGRIRSGMDPSWAANPGTLHGMRMLPWNDARFSGSLSSPGGPSSRREACLSAGGFCAVDPANHWGKIRRVRRNEDRVKVTQETDGAPDDAKAKARGHLIGALVVPRPGRGGLATSSHCRRRQFWLAMPSLSRRWLPRVGEVGRHSSPAAWHFLSGDDPPQQRKLRPAACSPRK